MYDEILCKRFSIPSVLSLNMRDIIQLIRKGDHHAFNRIVHQFQTSFMKIAFQYSQDWDCAADITQDTFVKSFKKMDSSDSNFFCHFL